MKVKFPFLEGVDAAFCAADGVVILKFAFSKLKIQFKGKSKATTPSVTKSVTATPSKRGIKINTPLKRGIKTDISSFILSII
ncbi:hypothetical protein PW5551_01075 [Petrotoga sp. 9PW.55.5.1]|nr:hypothetical protein PW5551_01075 [Petrotoga sp. 9PW.55.5.1]